MLSSLALILLAMSLRCVLASNYDSASWMTDLLQSTQLPKQNHPALLSLADRTPFPPPLQLAATMRAPATWLSCTMAAGQPPTSTTWELPAWSSLGASALVASQASSIRLTTAW